MTRESPFIRMKNDDMVTFKEVRIQLSCSFQSVQGEIFSFKASWIRLCPSVGVHFVVNYLSRIELGKSFDRDCPYSIQKLMEEAIGLTNRENCWHIAKMVTCTTWKLAITSSCFLLCTVPHSRLFATVSQLYVTIYWVVNRDPLKSHLLFTQYHLTITYASVFRSLEVQLKFYFVRKGLFIIDKNLTSKSNHARFKFCTMVSFRY